jgi:hypothetical protein
MLNSGPGSLLESEKRGGAFLWVRAILNMACSDPASPSEAPKPGAASSRTPDTGRELFDAARSPSRRKGKCY